MGQGEKSIKYISKYYFKYLNLRWLEERYKGQDIGAFAIRSWELEKISDCSLTIYDSKW